MPLKSKSKQKKKASQNPPDHLTNGCQDTAHPSLPGNQEHLNGEKECDVSDRIALIKSYLHSSHLAQVSCRERELCQLELFIEDRLDANVPGALYISGPPGTGKSACVRQLLRQIESRSRPVKKRRKSTIPPPSDIPLIIEVNCMHLSSPAHIHRTLLERLSIGGGIGKAEERVHRELVGEGRMVLLVLDEVDRLAEGGAGQQVLYSLFSWPTLPRSRLVLIAIANTLDLTDRLLPRLQTRLDCQPTHLPFLPYSPDQLSLILSSRLEEVPGWQRLLHPDSVGLCARKVAAVHGDARKALDVLRRAVELWESEGSGDRVSVPHVAKTFSQVCSGTGLGAKSAYSQSGEELPIQQKITVCSLLLKVRDRSVKQVKLGTLHDTYASVCRERHVTPLAQSEFVDLCRLLESRGVLEVKGAKEIRMFGVRLMISEGEVAHALRDQTLISSILAKKPDPAMSDSSQPYT